MQKIELKINEKQIQDLIKSLVNENRDFEVIRTGYTVRIKIPELKKQYFFSEKSGGKLFLCFYSKLKANVKGVQTGVKFKDIIYYKFNHLTDIPEKMYCCDLNSAYLQALFNAGIINESSFNFGSKIPKVDRLKGVGALATKKTITKYTGGKMHPLDLIKSEEENVFFFACYSIGKLLSELIKETPNFLFFWVDGIYFKTICDAYKARQFFSNYSFPSKIEYCENSKILPSGKYLTYRKGKNLKVFSIPQNENRITDEKIIEWITKKNIFGSELN